jgi:hypothetical protein
MFFSCWMRQRLAISPKVLGCYTTAVGSEGTALPLSDSSGSNVYGVYIECEIDTNKHLVL